MSVRENRRGEQGYAFIEMLLAIAVAGLAVSATTLLFSLWSKARAAAHGQIEFVSSAASNAEFFTRSLEQLVLSEIGGFYGNANEVHFKARPPNASGMDDIVAQRWRFDEDKRTFTLTLQTVGGESQLFDVGREKIVKFSFFGASAPGQIAMSHEIWQSSWQLPRQINLKFSSADGSQLIEYVAEIRNNGLFDCDFVPRRSICGGVIQN